MKKRKPRIRISELIFYLLILAAVLFAMFWMSSYATEQREANRKHVDPAHQDTERYIYPPRAPYVIPNTYDDEGADFSLTLEYTIYRWDRYEEDILALPEPRERDISDAAPPLCDMPPGEEISAVHERHRPSCAMETAGEETQLSTATTLYTGKRGSLTDRDVEMAAKMLYGEGRGVPPEQQALCVWTALNRLDSGRFGETFEAVITAENQFRGYNEGYPVTDDIRAVVEEVFEAWERGETAPVLHPYARTNDYLFFSGDGRNNWFR